jgi:hypothetical protein
VPSSRREEAQVSLRSLADDPVSEGDLVAWWREQTLTDAGYPLAVAVSLAADADVDLHTAVGLLERGCELKVALRILAPLPAA